MSERDFRDCILDIDKSISFIIEFTKDMTFDKFRDDAKTHYAVTRCFEIIGEAVKRLPVSVTEKYPDIPWKIMAGMRDRLIHGYDVVDITILWRTVQQEIPPLKKNIQMIKKELMPD